MSRLENFYGPYLVPFNHVTPDLETWIRNHAEPLDWRVNVNESSGGLEFYFRDAEVGTLFALTWS